MADRDSSRRMTTDICGGPLLRCASFRACPTSTLIWLILRVAAGSGRRSSSSPSRRRRGCSAGAMPPSRASPRSQPGCLRCSGRWRSSLFSPSRVACTAGRPLSPRRRSMPCCRRRLRGPATATPISTSARRSPFSPSSPRSHAGSRVARRTGSPASGWPARWPRWCSSGRAESLRRRSSRSAHCSPARRGQVPMSCWWLRSWWRRGLGSPAGRPPTFPSGGFNRSSWRLARSCSG